LNRVDRTKPLETRLFNAIARHSVTICFEAVLLRKNEQNNLEIFLAKRSANQTYANQWHIPGSIFRALESATDVAVRLSELEFGAKIETFRFCEEFFYEAEYGTILDQIYLVEINEPIDEKFGTWFPINQLPTPFCEFHKNRILPILSRYI
ncbi:MAG: NUDIX domain-containing protein, partial [Candidatus Falkowbacteria bacterium]